VNTAQRAGSFAVDVTFLGAEDYDIHIFDIAGNEVGVSTGTNSQQEHAVVNCPSLGRGPYKVRVVYFQTLMDTVKYSALATYTDSGACPGAPAPTYVDDALTFAPGTLVSAHFLGVEPQTNVERTNDPAVPAGNPGGISNNRIFVDWPLSSRSNIGQLSRSLDGGDSFRLLIDLTCAVRSRPMCLTGGGGDTEADINPKNGHVFFSDQEALANEAEATSTDHGDSFTFQTLLTNVTTATDRQWLAATDSSAQLLGQPIESFFSYHVPPQAYIHAIPEATHLPAPQPAPQLQNTAQTGQMKVDNNPASPGHGWIYYPFNGFISQGGTIVATARSSSFQLPIDWQSNLVEPNGATSFPWIAIDSAGNVYVSFDVGGSVFYSYSLMSDARNNPSAGGRPGSVWSQPAELTPPGVTSAIFPEIIAGGDVGRIGLTYIGTNETSGDPGTASANTHWHTYAPVITGANTSNPVVHTGRVSHRVSHHGNICTHGTTCGLPPNPPSEDRSLADMIDVGFDNQGRLGVVYQDNNTASFQDIANGPDTSPFAYFAKEVTGPTMFAATSPVNISIPRDARDDPAGDATWPNTAAGTNIPALDIRRASLALVGSNLVAKLKLADASVSAMQSAVTAYNAVTCVGTCQAERLQYIVRFNTATETYHMSLEVQPNGTTRPFGGKLNNADPTLPGQSAGDDGIPNPGNPQGQIAAGHHTDAAFTVTATITPGANGEVTLSAPASQFGLATGSNLYSVTGLATAGPNEINPTTQLRIPQIITYMMRTVDAAPPFETTLGSPTNVGLFSFTASRPTRATKTKPRIVTLRWKTGAEPDTLGFNVYREVGKKATKLNKALIGSKGAVAGASYKWLDKLPKTFKGSPCYRLESVSGAGTKTVLKKTCPAK
jgi:hypothetical protein